MINYTNQHLGTLFGFSSPMPRSIVWLTSVRLPACVKRENLLGSLQMNCVMNSQHVLGIDNDGQFL